MALRASAITRSTSISLLAELDGALAAGDPVGSQRLAARANIQAGAMVDVLSGGRLVLGVAAGYAPTDLAAFGVEPGSRRKRMEEGLTLIKRVWEEETVDFEGEHYRVTDYDGRPKPVQSPCPPILIGGGGLDLVHRLRPLLPDEVHFLLQRRVGVA